MSALIVIEFGLSEFEAVLLLSLPGVATFLLILPVSLIADLRRNRLEPFVAGLALASGAFFSMAQVSTFGVLLAPAFPARCGNAVFHPCGTALVAERFPDRRAMAISLLLPVIWFRYRWIRGGQPPAGPKSLLTGAPNLVVEVLSPRTAERVTI